MRSVWFAVLLLGFVCAVTSQVVSDISFSILNANGVSRVSQKYPSMKTSSQVQSFTEGETLDLKFEIKDKSGEPLSPQQVFLRIAGGQDKEFVMVSSRTGDSFSFSVASHEFGGVHGEYELTLIVGDSKFTPLLWKIGSVKLEGAGAITPQHGFYAPQPLITHKFAESTNRPPQLVSTVFVGLVASPLLVLVLLWSRLGVNTKGFPSGSSGLAALLFYGSLGATLLVLAYGWFYWNMFQIVGYSGLTSFVSIVVGKKLLGSISGQKK